MSRQDSAMTTTRSMFPPLFALSAALASVACTLPTKLADLSEGDGSSDPGTTSGGEPTTGGNDSTPINSGGESTSTGASSGGSSGGSSGETPECVTHTLTPLRPNVVL